MSNGQRDPFFDDNDVGIQEQSNEVPLHPVPTVRKRLSVDTRPTETAGDPTATSRSPSPPVLTKTLIPLTETINEEIPARKPSSSSSSRSSESDSFESDIDDEKEEVKTKTPTLPRPEVHLDTQAPVRSIAHVNTQTDQTARRDESIQTETVTTEDLPKSQVTRHVALQSKFKKSTMPLVKTLLEQPLSSALPIISFCQPFSMTSHLNDIVLAMPRHLMIVNNQNSVTVHPWQQPQGSTSTILECFWCSFLYKLLVTTVEDNRLFIYDFVSIIDSIKLRGQPLSIKHQGYNSQGTDSSFLLPPSSRHQSLPAVWSQTRFTKSNPLGIYYCYISDRHSSFMLTRINHNTRQHMKAIDCSGGSINSNTCVCAMGLSDEQVAIVLTNLVMTFYDAETLVGLKQINLCRWNGYHIRGVSAVVYLWRTWLVFDPIDNKVIGVGKRKRQFVKTLAEQPVNACPMDDGTLTLWLGYPGALLSYRLLE